MFTGIIEEIAKVVKLERDNENLHISCESLITSELNIDQSVSHNGVCLTVIDISEKVYTVTAIKETLDKTNLGLLKLGDNINLERSMKLGDRLDGHMVQGHVDQTARCSSINKYNGSFLFSFDHKLSENFTVQKGSICINGVSLTVVDSQDTFFTVAVIPYTYKHTNFSTFGIGTIVNIEFDIIGKYISKMFIKNL